MRPDMSGRNGPARFRCSALAITLMCLLLAGCKPTTAADQMLADASAACSTLATYYEDLATTTLDSWQNQTVYNVLLKMPAPDGKMYEERLQAFRERANLAHAAGAAYDRLKQLRDPSGLAKVKTAGNALGQTIQGIGGLPGATKPATDELGNAAALLANLQRERDLKRALKAMGDFNAGIESLFAEEKRIYLNVDNERTGTSEHLLEVLAGQKLVNPAALLQGLRVGLPVSAGTDEKAHDAGLAIAKLSVERADLGWQCATEQTAAMLSSLHGLNRDESASLRLLEEQTTRANACLKERDDILKGKP